MEQEEVERLVYECPRHGYFFAAFTPAQWRFATGGAIRCPECSSVGYYRPELDAAEVREGGKARP